jgi:hypothetical protein
MDDINNMTFNTVSPSSLGCRHRSWFIFACVEANATVTDGHHESCTLSDLKAIPSSRLNKPPLPQLNRHVDMYLSIPTVCMLELSSLSIKTTKPACKRGWTNIVHQLIFLPN